jgi:hypothetical protein
MFCSGTASGLNVISDMIYKRIFRLILSDDTMQFNRPSVIGFGAVPLAPSVWTVGLHEIYALFLRAWVEIVEADEEIHTWVWNNHLEVYVGQLNASAKTHELYEHR